MPSNEIKQWMLYNLDTFRDAYTDEINYTAMVEAWDREHGNGCIKDPYHDAWKVALLIAIEE